MSKKDEALDLAQKALESYKNFIDDAHIIEGQWHWIDGADEAITAIKQAQTQTVQEPRPSFADVVRAEPTELIQKWRVLDLYRAYEHCQFQATPPAAPVPLTDEQVEQIYKEQTGSFIDDSPWALMDFVRAIEAAHGITKGGAA
jgi:hypothetical protein